MTKPAIWRDFKKSVLGIICSGRITNFMNVTDAYDDGEEMEFLKQKETFHYIYLSLEFL